MIDFWESFNTTINVGGKYPLHEYFMLKVLEINKSSLIAII